MAYVLCSAQVDTGQDEDGEMSNILNTYSSINAFATAQAALLNCRVAGMQAENQQRLSLGYSVAYGHDAFSKVDDEFQALIGSNELLLLYAQAGSW